MKPGEAGHLLRRVTVIYTRTLRNNQEALEKLKAAKLYDPSLIEAFQIGFSDGSMNRLLPKTGRVLADLRALGVLSEKGEEELLSCVTIPLLDSAGNPQELYGLRFLENGIQETYAPIEAHGIFNRPAVLQNRKLVVTSNILDALSLWRAGFRNVLAFYGIPPSSEELEHLFTGNNVAQIHLCFNSSTTGPSDRSLEAVLSRRIRSVRSLYLPTGAYGFFLRHNAEDFGDLLATAGSDPPTDLSFQQPARTITNDLEMTIDARHYDLRAIETPSPGVLKATIRAAEERGRFVLETIDFNLPRSQCGFVDEAARLFGQRPAVIEADLDRIKDHLETRLQEGLEETRSSPSCVSDVVPVEGLQLGRNSDLTGEIVRDMGRLGIIGETANKLIAYLVMTSRLLPEPLALLILSGSGAGKSHLQDLAVSLCPDEDRISLTSVTERALFYKGKESLRHKVLAVEGTNGAMGAQYAIRNLITARRLVIESTIKNPYTGKLETQNQTVHGPTAVFQTTTSQQIDAEARSRFILVSVDESVEQTRAILKAQRQSHTLEGWRQRHVRETILRRHHAFQRLLRPLLVVNPFEPLLSFPEQHLLVRRDHPKYLTLILTVTFLHQMQRPIKQDPELGDYIETTLSDVATANNLAHHLFGHNLADLSRPGQELLRHIGEHVAGKTPGGPTEAVTFNRRELREALKWGDTRLRLHLRELVEMQYIVPLSGRFGQTYYYRLLCAPAEEPRRFLAGLKSLEQLRQEAVVAGILPHSTLQDCDLAPTSHLQKCEDQPPDFLSKRKIILTTQAQVSDIREG